MKEKIETSESHQSSHEDINVSHEQDYKSQVAEKMRAINGLHTRFLMEAVDRDVPEGELSEVTAAAMSEGVIPAVAQFQGYGRYPHYRPTFLSGNIPAKALEVYVDSERGAVGIITGMGEEVIPTIKETVIDMANQSNGEFTAVEELQLLREYGEEEGRGMVLAKLDEALQPFTEEQSGGSPV